MWQIGVRTGTMGRTTASLALEPNPSSLMTGSPGTVKSRTTAFETTLRESSVLKAKLGSCILRGSKLPFRETLL
jgi:hypothetical protein